MNAKCNERYSIGSDVLPGLSKIIEETGELNDVIGKIIGLGSDGEHWNGKNLRVELIHEMADVTAAINFYMCTNLTTEEVDELYTRTQHKVRLYSYWHENGILSQEGEG